MAHLFRTTSRSTVPTVPHDCVLFFSYGDRKGLKMFVVAYFPNLFVVLEVEKEGQSVFHPAKAIIFAPRE